MRFSLFGASNAKMHKTVLVAILLCLPAMTQANDNDHVAASPVDCQTRIRAVDGRLAVYAFSNTSSEVIAWLPASALLNVKGDLTESRWVCVEPTDAMSVWVYRELIRDSRVSVDKSQIRAGIGMGSRPVARLDKGTPVEIRGTYGEWVKIRPPHGIGFWVLRDQVEPVADVPHQATETMPYLTDAATDDILGISPNEKEVRRTDETTEMALDVRVRPPIELDGFELDTAAVQGQRLSYRGILDFGGVASPSFPYYLLKPKENGEMSPICHLTRTAGLCDELTGTTVAIEGTGWFVKGYTMPVVIPRTISRIVIVD